MYTSFSRWCLHFRIGASSLIFFLLNILKLSVNLDFFYLFMFVTFVYFKNEQTSQCEKALSWTLLDLWSTYVGLSPFKCQLDAIIVYTVQCHAKVPLCRFECNMTTKIDILWYIHVQIFTHLVHHIEKYMVLIHIKIMKKKVLKVLPVSCMVLKTFFFPGIQFCCTNLSYINIYPLHILCISWTTRIGDIWTVCWLSFHLMYI